MLGYVLGGLAGGVVLYAGYKLLAAPQGVSAVPQAASPGPVLPSTQGGFPFAASLFGGPKQATAGPVRAPVPPLVKPGLTPAGQPDPYAQLGSAGIAALPGVLGAISTYELQSQANDLKAQQLAIQSGQTSRTWGGGVQDNLSSSPDVNNPARVTLQNQGTARPVPISTTPSPAYEDIQAGTPYAQTPEGQADAAYQAQLAADAGLPAPMTQDQIFSGANDPASFSAYQAAGGGAVSDPAAALANADTSSY